MTPSFSLQLGALPSTSLQASDWPAWGLASSMTRRMSAIPHCCEMRPESPRTFLVLAPLYNLSYRLRSLVLTDTWDFDHLPYFPLLQEMLSTSINQSLRKLKQGPSGIRKTLPHGVQLDSQQHPNPHWVSQLSTVSWLAPTNPKLAVLPGSGRRTGLESRGSDSASHKSVRR